MQDSPSGLELREIAEGNFADLALERHPVTRRLLYAPAPLAAVCRANGLDPVATLADEDRACALIAEWYRAHIVAGGEPDPVAEQILSEIAAAEGYRPQEERIGKPDPEDPDYIGTYTPGPRYH